MSFFTKLRYASIMEIYNEELTASEFSAKNFSLALSALYAFNCNKHKKALKKFEKILKSPSVKDRAYAHFFIGVVYKDMNLFKQAIDSYRQAIALEDSFYKFHNCLAWVYRMNEDYDLAIEEYHLALKMNPRSFLSYINLCNIYTLQNKFEKAVECGERAVALNPSRVEAHSNLCIAYANLGNREKVRAHYNQLVVNHYDALDNIKEMISEILKEKF